MPSDLIRSVVVCLKGRIMDSSCSNVTFEALLTKILSIILEQRSASFIGWNGQDTSQSWINKPNDIDQLRIGWAITGSRKSQWRWWILGIGLSSPHPATSTVRGWGAGAMWANALPKKPGDNWNTNPDFLTFHLAYALNIVSCWSSCLSGILTKVPGKRKQGIVEKVVKRVAVGKIGEH